MKIVSWNVNGIRACTQKGTFFGYLHEHDPDILFLQETKAHISQLPDEVSQPLSYYAEWFSAEQKGYSGVALLTKKKPISIITKLHNEAFDCEGRVIGAEFEDKVIFGVYFPNSQRPGRLEYKLKFYEAFFDLCDTYRKAGKHIIVSGDFNTAGLQGCHGRNPSPCDCSDLEVAFAHARTHHRLRRFQHSTHRNRPSPSR